MCFGQKKVSIDIEGYVSTPKLEHIHMVSVNLPCSWSEKPVVYRNVLPFPYTNGAFIVHDDKIILLPICTRFYLGSKELPDKKILLITEDVDEKFSKKTRCKILNEKGEVVQDLSIPCPKDAIRCSIDGQEKNFTVVFFDANKEISRENIQIQ
jgi:hypothetical protein